MPKPAKSKHKQEKKEATKNQKRAETTTAAASLGVVLGLAMCSLVLLLTGMLLILSLCTETSDKEAIGQQRSRLASGEAHSDGAVSFVVNQDDKNVVSSRGRVFIDMAKPASKNRRLSSCFYRRIFKQLKENLQYFRGCGGPFRGDASVRNPGTCL